MLVEDKMLTAEATLTLLNRNIKLEKIKKKYETQIKKKNNGEFFSTQRSIEYLPAEAVGVVAAEPGFRPSRLAKWASKASNKLLGAYKIHSFLANKLPMKVKKN